MESHRQCQGRQGRMDHCALAHNDICSRDIFFDIHIDRRGQGQSRPAPQTLLPHRRRAWSHMAAEQDKGIQTVQMDCPMRISRIAGNAAPLIMLL